MIEHMEKIREVRPLKRVDSFFGQLVGFLKEWSVIGVAIGVIVAQASKDFIDALVRGVIMPLIKVILGVSNLTGWNFTIGQEKFDIGNVMSSLITLIIVISILYYLVRRIMKRYGSDQK